MQAAIETGCESYGIEIDPARAALALETKAAFRDFTSKRDHALASRLDNVTLFSGDAVTALDTTVWNRATIVHLFDQVRSNIICFVLFISYVVDAVLTNSIYYLQQFLDYVFHPVASKINCCPNISVLVSSQAARSWEAWGLRGFDVRFLSNPFASHAEKCTFQGH